MRVSILAASAIMLAFAAPSAGAAPAGGLANGADVLRASDGIVKVATGDRDRRRMLRKRDGDFGYGHRRWHRRSFAWDDDRYRPYRGWHRYHSRPWGWRNRGCVAVGPIWFCP